MFLIKMSAYYYQGQAKEHKDEICSKHRGEEGNDTSSITAGGAACVQVGLLAGSSQSALGVVGLVYQEGPPCCLKGWVVTELFQQLKREPSIVISPIVVQIYSGKGREQRQLFKGSGSRCCWFWDVLRRTTSPPTVARYCRCIERS